VNGAFAEYTMAPKEAIGKIPPEISFDEGAFVEPLACCIQLTYHAQVLEM